MTDVHSSDQRARNMRAIRAKNTAPELIVRRTLHAAGFRFRIHAKHLPGSPDLVLPRYRTAIFVDGCFWHGHGCSMFKVPKTRTDFWMGKIRSNRARDLKTESALVEQGWRVFRIWECALKGPARIDSDVLLAIFTTWLRSSEQLGSIPAEGTQSLI